MRDLLILLAFPLMVYFIFRRPFVGTSLWIWSAMFFPNGWVWGVASSIRFNLIIALATVVSYVFQKDKIKTDTTALTFIIILFYIWTTISSIFTIANADVVWTEWGIFSKIIVFYIVCILTLKTKHHIHVFLWAIVLSGAYFGAAEGLKYLATIGGHKVEGIVGSRLSDRNELALAINMSIPILLFLVSQTKHKTLRMALLGATFFSIVAIIGSFSRGGLLALIVVGLYFFLQSKRKFLVVSLVSITLLVGTSFIPDKWFNRMDTIEEMDQDSSFLGRIVAWKQAVLMAADNPVFGAGFKAGQNYALWKLYELDFQRLDFIVDTSHFTAPKPKAAHSIYFQVLGDQGYVGLLIFLGIIFLCYRNLAAVKRESDDQWCIDLAKMLQVSLVAYCVGGAALSLPYFDLSFAIYALSHSLITLTRRKVKSKQPTYQRFT